MGDFIDPIDLELFAPGISADKAAAMIADVEAQAKLLAPCIVDTGFAYRDVVKAVLRAAILRWHDSGSGAVTSQTAGPFSMATDTRQPRRGTFWPSEIEQLQSLCRNSTDGDGDAFSVDTAPTVAAGDFPLAAGHAEVCSVNWGAYCSCGAYLTGIPSYPLYEV